MGRLAGLLSGGRERALRLAGFGVVALLALLLLLDQPTGLFQINRVKGVDEATERERVFEAWNSFSRVVGYRITNAELEGWGLAGDPNRPTVAEPGLLLIDGHAAPPVGLFDGALGKARHMPNGVTQPGYLSRSAPHMAVIRPRGGAGA